MAYLPLERNRSYQQRDWFSQFVTIPSPIPGPFYDRETQIKIVLPWVKMR